MNLPVLQRLTDELAYPLASPDNIDALIAQAEEVLVLFFPGNPQRYPESQDVAVILPELITAFNGQLSAAVVPPEHDAALRECYPFNVWPGLVFLRKGVQLGSICKVQDWLDYIKEIGVLLKQEPSGSAIPSVQLT